MDGLNLAIESFLPNRCPQNTSPNALTIHSGNSRRNHPSIVFPGHLCGHDQENQKDVQEMGIKEPSEMHGLSPVVYIQKLVFLSVAR
jgi:hypothetical protein